MDKIAIKALNIWFDSTAAIKDLNLEVRSNEILGIIGSAKSGKTSFLRAINRMNDLNSPATVKGEILLDNKNREL